MLDNEDLYVDKIDKAIGEANLEYGSGVHDYGGMTDELAESEWRFDIVGKNYGGHL